MTAAPQRHILVTGGTSGIGEAIATAFYESGAVVTVTGLTEEELRASGQRQPGLRAVRLDVSDSAAVTQVVAELGELDAVVNCAGTILRSGAEFDPEQFSRVLDINLTGTMRVCTAARPLLRARRGCIVNLASMLSYFGSGFVPGYSASKGGIVQLTKSLAIAWAAEGIRVNAVAPGWIETALTRPLTEDAERRQRITDRTPLGRWGQPEEVTGGVLFLCSPAAAFITGVVLPIDGGYACA